MWDPAVKTILKALRCPICGGALDLYELKPKAEQVYNFCCVNDWEHYRMWFVHWEPLLRVEYEKVVLYEGDYQYAIVQNNYGNDKNHLFGVNGDTTITISKVDPEKRIIETLKPKNFWYTKKFFDFNQTNRDRIVNRIKTILTFQ